MFVGSVSVNQLLCIAGELARGVFVAVAVSVGDRGKVTCDM